MANILHVLWWKIQLLSYKACPGFQPHFRITRVWHVAPHSSSLWTLSSLQSMKVLLPYNDTWHLIKTIWDNDGLRNTVCCSIYSAYDICWYSVWMLRKLFLIILSNLVSPIPVVQKYPSLPNTMCHGLYSRTTNLHSFIMIWSIIYMIFCHLSSCWTACNRTACKGCEMVEHSLLKRTVESDKNGGF